MDFGFNVGYTNTGNNKSATVRLYALNGSGKQEPVYDGNGEPIYTKREA